MVGTFDNDCTVQDTPFRLPLKSNFPGHEDSDNRFLEVENGNVEIFSEITGRVFEIVVTKETFLVLYNKII